MSGFVHLDHPVPLLRQAPGRNDCGPHATAMAAGFFGIARADPRALAADMRLLRAPWLGATLPWAIPRAVRKSGLEATGGWFNGLGFIRHHIAANHPVIVVVKPSDLVPCPWYALHYRVVVGYWDDPSQAGGGRLFFNCSAAPPRVNVVHGAPGETRGSRPATTGHAASERRDGSGEDGGAADGGEGLEGNVTVNYRTFARQWRTYLTINWAVAVLPRAQAPTACA